MSAAGFRGHGDSTSVGLDLRSDHSLLLGHRALMLKATMPCTTPPGLGRHLHWDWLGPSYRGGRTPSVHRAWKVREAALSAQTIRDLLRHAEEVQPDSGSQCVSKFFFLHKPLLTSNFFFPLQSRGTNTPGKCCVSRGLMDCSACSAFLLGTCIPELRDDNQGHKSFCCSSKNTSTRFQKDQFES